MPEVQELDGRGPATEEEIIDVAGVQTCCEDVFDIEMGQERYKALPGQLLDSLQKLATLLAALIGGGLVALRDDLMRPGWRVSAIACLILALAATLVGILPLTFSTVFLNVATSLRQHTNRLIKRRGWSLIVAGVLLVLGFAVALAGLAIGPARAN